MIKGDVFFSGQKLGTFTVCDDDKILVELNGGRWDIQDVFRQALRKGRSFSLFPTEDNTSPPRVVEKTEEKEGI
jgi:hypothetical protein